MTGVTLDKHPRNRLAGQSSGRGIGGMRVGEALSTSAPLIALGDKAATINTPLCHRNPSI